MSDGLPEDLRERAGEVWLDPGRAYVGTCDAGGCDEETEAIVLTDHGWIAMCRHHAHCSTGQGAAS